MRKNRFLGLLTAASLFGLLLVSSQSAFAAQLSSPAGNGVSYNWSGYVATTGPYTSVGASWTVPQVTAGNADLSADATWVGIGGLTTTDLIQAGTQAVIQNGMTTYEAWYETLPSASIQVPLAVHPGDAVTVSLAEQSTGQWEISFSDAMTGQNYQTSVSYDSSLSSAEWIEEMPSDEQGMVPLDNFGTVSFSNGFTVENGSTVSISGSGATPMTMITNTDQALATPSALGADGASFTVTRSSVAASTPSITRTGRWSRVGVGVQGYTPPQRRQSEQQLQPQARSIGTSSRGFFTGRFGSFFTGFGGVPFGILKGDFSYDSAAHRPTHY